MSGKIKFRAWDKVDKKMIYWSPFTLLVDIIERDVESVIPLPSIVTDYENFYERFEHIQFTGLYDKNGLEIYKGDIVETYTMYDGEEWTSPERAAVEYGMHTHSCGEWGCGESYMMFHATYDILTEQLHNDGVEVIGNIYENPELLEGGGE